VLPLAQPCPKLSRSSHLETEVGTIEGIAAQRVPLWYFDEAGVLDCALSELPRCAKRGTRNIPCASCLPTETLGKCYRWLLLPSTSIDARHHFTMCTVQDSAPRRCIHVIMANLPLPPSVSSHRFSGRPTRAGRTPRRSALFTTPTHACRILRRLSIRTSAMGTRKRAYSQLDGLSVA
jgi:hypothetical protein